MNQPLDIQQTLKLNSPPHKRWTLIIVTGLLLLTISFFAAKFLFFNTEQQKLPQFETVPLKRGDLELTVTATGTLAPVTQVDIGIEVSGTVAQINVDFNDTVKAGQVLAVLDTTKLSSQVQQDQGVLAQAQARLLDAQATVLEKQKSLAFIQQARELSHGQVPAKQDLISAEASLKRALAQENLVKGQISQAEGQLRFDTTNLNKASIKTPIDGIVLDRRIEKGQTVAASLQTPLMFTIAKNLTEMALHINVDEADVGKIRIGQAATFTVDAYPDRNFPATVSQIRYAPQTVGGVVTYETILLVNNADLLLRPGMTATANLITQKIQNVLLVPNTALRFKPFDENNKKREVSFIEKIFPRTSSNSGIKKQAQSNKKEKRAPKIWVLENNQPQAIKVKVGANDGEMNEVSAPQLKEGLQVIVDTLGSGKNES